MTSEDLYPPRLSTVLALAWKRPHPACKRSPRRLAFPTGARPRVEAIAAEATRAVGRRVGAARPGMLMISDGLSDDL